MRCRAMAIPGGGTAIVCGSRSNGKRCPCGREPTALCDYPIKKRNGRQGTCDRPMCDRCRNLQRRVPKELPIKLPTRGDTIDFCQAHVDLLFNYAGPLVELYGPEDDRPMWALNGPTLAQSEPHVVTARPAISDGVVGWHVRFGCVLSFAEYERLSLTREAAEERKAVLLGWRGSCPL